jgi:UDP-N-acetylmuramyl pentapeptide synthase
MLDLLKKLPGKNKFALLGDIRELGEVTQLEHEKVAQKASETCNAVLLVGPQMKQFALPLIEKTSTQVHWFRHAYFAADFLQHQLKKDDILLVKSSQNTLLLEIAVEKLMANPKQANQLLARRGKFWDLKREEINSI